MANNLKNNTQTEDDKRHKAYDIDLTPESEVEIANEYEVEKIKEKEVMKTKTKKKLGRPLKIFGWACIALSVALSFMDSPSYVDSSDMAKQAIIDKVSTSLPKGTRLLNNDENIGQADYTISHQNNETNSLIWIWDYAAEDGDYVQVLINGVPMGDAFMIKNKPVELSIPTVGTVQIKGIKDGGGGITYAVRYQINGTNYFNSAPEGEYNTYTLIKVN